MRTSSSRWRIVSGIVVAALAACLGLGVAGTASAETPECAGHGVPDSKISIQLWTFAEYVGFGTDAATIARLEEVLSSLSEMGYRNVEPFTLSGLSAADYRALLDKASGAALHRPLDGGFTVGTGPARRRPRPRRSVPRRQPGGDARQATAPASRRPV